MSSTEQSPDEPTGGSLATMPNTAYLVLGMLSLLGESLTAGEIRSRAEHTLGNFYWSPAVSHIRRELARLVANDLVEEKRTSSGSRVRITYTSTKLGDDALREWVADLPDGRLVIKHPLMLRLFLSADAEPAEVLPSIDKYLADLNTRIEAAQWVTRTGIQLNPEIPVQQRYPWMVAAYTLRSLYAEMANVRQLRDDIEWQLSTEYPAGSTDEPPPSRR